MIEYDKNIDTFRNLEPDFNTPNEDIWAQIEAKTSSSSNTKSVRLNWWALSAAASVVLILGIGLFMRLYTVNLTTSNGQQFSQELPDGSQIQLNAASSASFQPYWWNFNRKIELQGEAFFKVAKGERFSVVSEEATTTVLGTSFNVFAREKEYKVYCKTGKVSVSSNTYDIKYKITAGELAIIDNINKAGSKKHIAERDFLAWTLNKFSFTNTPLPLVLNEMERQYNISIDYSNEIDNMYFGAYFDKPASAKEAIDLICLQFNLNFEETEKGKYLITKE